MKSQKSSKHLKPSEFYSDMNFLPQSQKPHIAFGRRCQNQASCSAPPQVFGPNIFRKQQIEMAQLYSKTKEKLANYDFNYLFFNENKMNYLDLCIDAIDKLHGRKSEWIKSEIHKLGCAFVLQKLNQEELFDDLHPTSMQIPSVFDLNKVTWSEMFMDQPQVQQLTNDFFNELVRLLQNETTYNRKQLKHFLQFPRHHAPKPSKAQSYTEEKLQTLKHRAAFFNKLKHKKGTKEKRKSSVIPEASHTYSEEEKEGTQNNTDQMLQQQDGNFYETQDEKTQKFFDNMPKVLLQKNKRLIEKIKQYIKTEQQAKRKFEAIVNSKNMFQEKIDQLAKLHEELEKEQNEKERKNYIKSSLMDIQQKLTAIERDDINLMYEVDNPGLVQIVRKAERPGEKLLDKLFEWKNQLKSNYMTSEEIYKWSCYAWDVLGDFEEELRRTNPGWLLERRSIINFYKVREQQLKEHFSFRIEAMEAAMHQVKLEAMQKVDRVMMEMNDLESQMMNLEIQDEFKTVEDYILEQHKFITDLGIDALREFRNPFQLLAHEQISGAGEDARLKKLMQNLDPVNHRAKLKQEEAGIAFSSSQGPRVARSRYKIDCIASLRDPKVQVELRDLETLNQRINKYFKAIKQLTYTLNKSLCNLDYKDVEMSVMEHVKDQMHQKCIKYHDVIRGVFRLFIDMLHQNNIISDQDKLLIGLLMHVEDNKLTFEVKQLTTLLETLHQFKLGDKLIQFQAQQVKIKEQYFHINKLVESIPQNPWMQEIEREVSNIPSNYEVHQTNTEFQLYHLVKDIHKQFTQLKSLEKFNADDYLEILCEDTKHSKPQYNQQQEHQVLKSKTASMTIQVKESEASKKSNNGVNKTVKDRRQTTSASQQKQQTLSEMESKQRTMSQRKVLLKSKSSMMEFHSSTFNEKSSLFAETAESLTQSHIRKSIFQQYDQFTNCKITKDQLESLMTSLKSHPISAFLLKRKNATTLDRSSKRNSGEQSPLHAENQLDGKSSFSSDDNEVPLDFDFLIQQMNNEIAKIFLTNQIERCKERRTSLITAAASQAKKQMFIKPIDCINIQPYSCPQLNLIPFKVLLLQKRDKQAIDVLKESLRMIAIMFPDLNLNPKNNLRHCLTAEADVQTVEEKITNFMRLQDILGPLVEKKLWDIQVAAAEDKIFIDEFDSKIRLFRDIKLGLRICDNENDLLNYLSSKMQDFIVEIEKKIVEKVNIGVQQETNALKQEIEKLQQQNSQLQTEHSHEKISEMQDYFSRLQSEENVFQKGGKESAKDKILRQASINNLFLNSTTAKTQARLSMVKPVPQLNLKQQPAPSNSQPTLLKLAREEELIRRSQFSQFNQKEDFMEVLLEKQKASKGHNQSIQVQVPFSQIMVEAKKESVSSSLAAAAPVVVLTPENEKETQTDQKDEILQALTTSTVEIREPTKMQLRSSVMCETDIDSVDFQLLVQFKERAVNKIQNLEAQLAEYKQAGERQVCKPLRQDRARCKTGLQRKLTTKQRNVMELKSLIAANCINDVHINQTTTELEVTEQLTVESQSPVSKIGTIVLNQRPVTTQDQVRLQTKPSLIALKQEEKPLFRQQSAKKESQTVQDFVHIEINEVETENLKQKTFDQEEIVAPSKLYSSVNFRPLTSKLISSLKSNQQNLYSRSFNSQTSIVQQQRPTDFHGKTNLKQNLGVASATSNAVLRSSTKQSSENMILTRQSSSHYFTRNRYHNPSKNKETTKSSAQMAHQDQYGAILLSLQHLPHQIISSDSQISLSKLKFVQHRNFQ